MQGEDAHRALAVALVVPDGPAVVAVVRGPARTAAPESAAPGEEHHGRVGGGRARAVDDDRLPRVRGHLRGHGGADAGQRPAVGGGGRRRGGPVGLPGVGAVTGRGGARGVTPTLAAGGQDKQRGGCRRHRRVSPRRLTHRAPSSHSPATTRRPPWLVPVARAENLLTGRGRQGDACTPPHRSRHALAGYVPTGRFLLPRPVMSSPGGDRP